MKCQMIIPQKKELLKSQKYMCMLVVSQLFSVLLVCSLVFLPSSSSRAEEQVTGQETTTNYMPGMEQFQTSGATKSQQSGNGCTNTAFCTGGKQGPGGTFTSTFDLKDKMTIDDINRGFTLDYGMDVKSHSSNASLSSCVGGNTMQAADCRDIFKLTVSLFDSGSILAHKFEHEVELDFSGIKSYAYQQAIPQNTFTGLTGEFEMFGIDAGFPNKFYGPQFSNPSLTTTFDLVTFIEAEVIDILNNTNILETNVTQIETLEITEIEVEVETQNGQMLTTLELEVNIEMELEMPSTGISTEIQTAPEVEVEAAEINTEIEMEMQDGNTTESMESSEPTESETNTQNEPESEPEPAVETEPTEQEGESNDAEETNNDTEEPVEGNEPVQSENEEEAEEENSRDTPAAKKRIVAKKAKEKVAKKIMKKMGSKGRYSSTNQLKTLVIMQVLGNTKSFFSDIKILQDTPGFFTLDKIPDTQISDNNYNQYFMFGGSDASHNALIESQYRR